MAFPAGNINDGKNIVHKQGDDVFIVGSACCLQLAMLLIFNSVAGSVIQPGIFLLNHKNAYANTIKENEKPAIAENTMNIGKNIKTPMTPPEENKNMLPGLAKDLTGNASGDNQNKKVSAVKINNDNIQTAASAELNHMLCNTET